MRKNYKPNTYLNPVYNYERRYATILTTVFICFTYGFALPTIPVVSFLALGAQYILDKLLVTYYYKEQVEHNDYLNRVVLNILKYGIVSFYLFAAYA